MEKTSPHLSEYFRAMGKKGGKARAEKLSKKRRKEIACLGGKAKGKNARKAASSGS